MEQFLLDLSAVNKPYWTRNIIVGCPPTGQYLAGAGVRTFACSETQKFGHVTFFWNGNRSGFFDEDLETFVEVRGMLQQDPDRHTL